MKLPACCAFLSCFTLGFLGCGVESSRDSSPSTTADSVQTPETVTTVDPQRKTTDHGSTFRQSGSAPTGPVVLADQDPNWLRVIYSETRDTLFWMPTMEQALAANEAIQQCLLEPACREKMIRAGRARRLRSLFGSDVNAADSGGTFQRDVMRDTSELAAIRDLVVARTSERTTRVFVGMEWKKVRFFWVLWRPDTLLNDSPREDVTDVWNDRVALSYWPATGDVRLERYNVTNPWE